MTKEVRFGPIALTTTLTTNLLNPPTLTGGVNVPGTTVNTFYVIKSLFISNKASSAATFSLWIGATGANAAGTEFIGTGINVPANSSVWYYPAETLDVADFLVGGSNTATALTISGALDIGIR